MILRSSAVLALYFVYISQTVIPSAFLAVSSIDWVNLQARYDYYSGLQETRRVSLGGKTDFLQPLPFGNAGGLDGTPLVMVNARKKSAAKRIAALIIIVKCYRLFLEIAVEETLEASAVTGFVLAHLVNCVVDSVKVVGLGEFSDA